MLQAEAGLGLGSILDSNAGSFLSQSLGHFRLLLMGYDTSELRPESEATKTSRYCAWSYEAASA